MRGAALFTLEPAEDSVRLVSGVICRGQAISCAGVRFARHDSLGTD